MLLIEVMTRRMQILKDNSVLDNVTIKAESFNWSGKQFFLIE